MALLETGRVCRKTCGNDAWEFCVIVGKADRGFEVATADGRKSKVSASHIEPTHWVVSGKDVKRELAELNLA
jgi:ribosomal protein L14E/L6E/L27E